jgi:hypothetical protein
MAYIGTKPANQVIDSTLIADGTVTTADIADSAVTAAKLASTLDLTGKTVTLPAGTGGKILQVVQATTNTPVTSNSATIVDVLSASITPLSSSNKILVMSAFGYILDDANDGFHETNGIAYLYRNSTLINAQNYLTYVSGESRSQGLRGYGGFSLVDSPSTTSSITYKISIASGDSAYTMTMPYGTFSGLNSICSLILLEVQS